MSEHFQVLAGEQMRDRIDSPVFRGAVPEGGRDGASAPRAGCGRVLLERGVRIFEDTPVTRFGTGDPVIAQTSGGSVRAGSAVVALNAWASHWKRFRRTLMVRGSYIVLTAPAPELLKEIGWTDGSGLADMRAAIHYVRTTPDRIAFGVGGISQNLARRIGPRFAYDEHAIRIGVADLHRMFPGTSTSRSRLRGAARSTSPATTSRRSGPSVGDPLPEQHGQRRRTRCTSAGRSSPTGSRGSRTPSSTCRSWTSSRSRPAGAGGALVANTAIRRKDESEDAGEEANPVVDFFAKLPRRLGYNLGP